MTERRKHQRYLVPTVMARVGDPDKSRARYVEDLSEGGVFLRTQNPPPVDSLLSIDLMPPGWETTIKLAGRVVRVAVEGAGGDEVPIGVGVEFVDVGDEERDLLTQLLQEYDARAPSGTDNGETLRNDPEELKREVSRLRTRLAETDVQVSALHAELEKFEYYELASRTLVAKLLEEQTRLRGEMRQAEQRHREALELQAKDFRALLQIELEQQLITERARTAQVELKLAEQAHAAKVRATELEAMFATAQAEFEKALAGDRVQAQPLLRALAEEQDLPVPASEAPQEETRGADRPSDLPDLDLPAPAHEPEEQVNLPAPLEKPVEDDPYEALPDLDSTPPFEEQAEAFGAEAEDLPEGTLDQAAFETYLRGGGRLLLTDNFHKITAVEKGIAQMTALLEEADSLEKLQAKAPAELHPRLLEYTYGFYCRGQIGLADAPKA